MLSDDAQPDLLASFLDHLDDPGAKEAYMFLVGAAATSSAYACRPQMKGVVRDFRFYDASGGQPHSFIVNKKSLLFYFRKPAVQTGLGTAKTELLRPSVAVRSGQRRRLRPSRRSPRGPGSVDLDLRTRF